MDFRRTTIADLAAEVAARKVSARELVTAALERIDEAVVGVRANRESRLEPSRRVSAVQRVEQVRVL